MIQQKQTISYERSKTQLPYAGQMSKLCRQKTINSKNMGTPTARLEHWLSFKGGRTKIVLCQD